MAELQPNPKQAEQQQPPSTITPAQESAPAVSGRTAFLDIKRQLKSEDLDNPGIQKLILDLLISTEIDRDNLKAELAKYVPKFNECDKRAAVLEEKLKTNKVNEIMSGAGLGLGCAMMGLSPFFWDLKANYGIITLALGLAVTVGASIGRIIFK